MLAINVTWDQVSQLLVIGVINGAAYGVLGVGFATILGVTGRFHFAFGFTYALAAYGVFWASARAGIPYVLAVLFGVLVCIIVGVAMERFAYRTLAKQAGAAALLAVFVASLGLAIAGENVIRLTFSSAAQQIGGGTSLRTAIHWGPTSFLWLDVWQVVSGFVLVLIFTLVLKYTGLGRSIKATRGNPEMARIIGIDPNRIYIICFAVGSLFAGVAAYWYGAKYSVQADMGFKPVIFAFVIGFLAGTASSPIRIFTVGIIVSIIEQLSSIFLEVRWTQLVVFVILVIYLGALSVEPRKVYNAVRHPRLFASKAQTGMQVWYFYIGFALIYVVFALSLNLLLGYAGQVSAAHAAFGAVGGFLTGYLLQSRHWNIVAAVLFGSLVAFVVGALVALPALKLSVEYLILMTLAMSSVIIGFFTTFDQLGGINGLTSLPKSNLFGWTWQNPSDWMIPLVVAVTVVYAICWRIGESPYGRVLKGIREDDLATRALGKNVFRFKVVVFAITSAMAGFAGGLLAAFFQLSTPGLFGFSISLSIIAMVIFGGMGNLTGALLGAAVLSSLDPILTRSIGLRADQAGFVRLIAYGLLLLLLVKIRPQGLLPEGYSLFGVLRGKRQAPIRTEMLRTEGWRPNVSESVAALAEAEEAYREHSTTVVGVGATSSVAGGVDPELARERLWERAPVILEVQNLSKRFGGIVAADELSMTLRKGTITALVGPNGAGKTTVFNLLTGFIEPDAGSVKLNGVELVDRTPDQVARRGMVRTFQDVRLFQQLSCLQNIQMAVQDQPGERLAPLFFQPRRVGTAERRTTERAMDSLQFVGMQEFARVPTGALSYGQSKLISLARALASDAEVLLLDEPASGIDTQWVDTMLGLIEALREQGRTVCIVEHNLHVVGRLADHTYFMELGRITAEGTIDQLTSSPRLSEAYFGTVDSDVQEEAAPSVNGDHAPVLEVEDLQAGYGRKQVVFDVGLKVGAGEMVTILGHNGSGKSTTIKTVLGLFPSMGGRVTFLGRDVSDAGSSANVKAGMALIPSERFVFPDLNVLDNLLLGGANEVDPVRRKERMAQVYELFPVLQQRSDQLAGTLSGGEQRMLSLGLLLMAGPKLLMLDEPSLGLAPVIVQHIFGTVRSLAQQENLSVLLLEQNVGQALRVTDRVYVMRSGRIILEETAQEMRARPSYWDLF